jgi:hypothetical protein
MSKAREKSNCNLLLSDILHDLRLQEHILSSICYKPAGTSFLPGSMSRNFAAKPEYWPVTAEPIPSTRNPILKRCVNLRVCHSPLSSIIAQIAKGSQSSGRLFKLRMLQPSGSRK